MKLFFTLGNFPPSTFGGISTSMFSVIDGLITMNYEVKVLTTSYKLPSINDIRTNEWSIYNGINVNYIRSRFPSFSLKYIFEGLRQIRQTDQLHLSGIFFFPSSIFALFAKYEGKNVFLSPHGELQTSALKYKSWKKKPYLKLLKICFKNVIFRATSKAEAIQIKKIFPKSEVYIIPNFLILENPLHKKKLDQFVFLGRICKIKRIENLILACSISKRFISMEYDLIIAGPSDAEFLEYESMLHELVKSHNLDKNIKFIGEINYPLKEELLSKSKALFLVSHSENFGNVVVESLAQGTPVVAVIGTPWESLVENNCGYWVDNTPASIASKIDEIISMNKDNYDRMSENAIAHSKEFTHKKVLSKWIEMINQFDIISQNSF